MATRREIMAGLIGASVLSGTGFGGVAQALTAQQFQPRSKGQIAKTPVDPSPPHRDAFVSVKGHGFVRKGRPYVYTGANLWYAAYLGARGSKGAKGEQGLATVRQDRLIHELDQLQRLGVRNLRILGSGETSPLKNAISPAIHDAHTYNEDLLVGLDRTLAEMAKRDMTAIVYLTNFWEWSGGMATYLYWTNGGHYIDANDPAHPWPEFADFTADFYRSGQAIALYHDYIRTLLGRTNTLNGRPYAMDPTVMAWQLANEPRPGGSDGRGRANLSAYYGWIEGTAALIRALAPHHLISLGHEGTIGALNDETIFNTAHGGLIDYTTAHIWPLNWAWVKQSDLSGTYRAQGEGLSQDYVDRHIRLATALKKPLVIEEFGLSRETGGFVPGSSTATKDQFYGLIYAAVLKSVRTGGPLVGANFWAWGGAARAQHGDFRWKDGDQSFVGDPPHEPQGWYSVFDKDVSTLKQIEAQALALSKL